MQTLDLECPTCGEHLELDAGFAGGVCRCSSCGTLMTVPRDAGIAEQLTAPESGAEMSDPSLPPTRQPQPQRSNPRQRAGSKKRGKRGKGKGRPQTATIDAGEYRTASGRVVTVDAPTRVPMAQSRRKQIRVITTIVFMSVVLGVTAVVTLAVWMMVSGDQTDGTGGGGDDVAAPVYDPSANPFSLEFPNVAGLPLEGKVAIVTEASKGDSEYWMPQAGDLIQAGLKAGDGSATVALFAAVKGEPAVFEGGKAVAPSKINQGKLGDWLTGLTFEKEIDRAGAIEKALAGKPDMLILVFSGGTRAEIEAWEKLVEKKDGLVVHGVLIDSSSPLSVQQWLVGRDDSEMVSVSSREIDSWRDAAGDD